MLVFAVLAQEFYQRRADQDPLAPLEPENNYTNAYIRGFAQQAQRFSFYMANYPDQYGRIQNYIIWNEPDKDLPASHFAALVRHCKQQMVQGPHIYWGGIFIPLGSFPDQWHLDYIAGVYQWLKDKGLAGAPDHGPWPWDGINLNIHRRRDDAFIDMLFDGFENPPGEPHKGVSQIKSDKGDAARCWSASGA